MKQLAILGASGHGGVIADIAELQGWGIIHFYDDSWPQNKQIGPWSVVGNTNALLKRASYYQGVVVAIGNNTARLEKQILLDKSGAHIIKLVHPTAFISNHATVGAGSIVMANAVINPFSRIGKSCIINTAATIDHDCLLAEGVHISPGANLAGGVVVGARSWVGIGACVKQLIQIEHDVIIGAGASVVNNLDANKIFVGVPAKLF